VSRASRALTLEAHALAGLPEIAPGDDLGALIAGAAGADAAGGRRGGARARAGAAGGGPGTSPRAAGGEGLRDGDVVVVAHKVVSKAEGRVRELADVEPTPRAHELAAQLDRDPRHIQAVLDEAAEVLRSERVLVCRTHHGFVCANAGVDASNAGAPGRVVLLPDDPDASARALRARLGELTGARPAVVVSDSFGRAWRLGQVEVAIGCAGLAPLDDWHGRADAGGRLLRATAIAVADEAAAAADLARAGKDAGEPVVVMRGLERFVTRDDGPGAITLVRPPAEDLFW
jgi:coenzyme F420-0:L-glutamate ligase/coenzyme F420-1:gamma-L-glutamate ligase